MLIWASSNVDVRKLLNRCRANSVYARESGPVSGSDFQVKAPKSLDIFKLFPLRSAAEQLEYRGTSLIRNQLLIGPYSRPVRRALRWS